jgi:uncharacterized repeat protein (TIGR01451 family)
VGTPLTTIQQAAGWAQMRADISSFIGKNVEVVFHLDTDGSVVLTGPAIDDVRVSQCTAVVGQAVANLGVTKTDGQGTYFPGEVLTYTIAVNNGGPSAVTGVNVTDNFPAQISGVTWSCSASAGSTCTNASGTGNIATTVDLLNGGTATFTAMATVSMTASGPLVNTATVAPPAGTSDPDPANNSSTDTDELIAFAPEALEVDAAGNGVFEPGETPVVAPTWHNSGQGAAALSGALSNHTGPPGPMYLIPDGAASYGTINGGASASCSSGSDCYSVTASGTRPATHWDSTVLETVSPTGATKTWTLHIGNSFTDVPTSNGFYRFIETILHNAVTGGCTATTYCPNNPTSREQMAVFVLVAREGAGYTPPDCAPPNLFNDVPETSGFCKFIEELANRGVVAGCGNGNYCPTDSTTREQMAVFVLRTLDPTLNPPNCVAGSELFGDVPSTSPFCKWIEELARRGVVTGCGNGNYCPTAAVTREQMSVFLTVTFGLVLYGL